MSQPKPRNVRIAVLVARLVALTLAAAALAACNPADLLGGVV